MTKKNTTIKDLKGLILSSLNSSGYMSFYQKFVNSLKATSGIQVLGLCPFHDDTNPSLSVNTETGLFHCFACGAEGDVFDFYQKYKDTNFSTALQEIGELIGVAEANIKQKVVATFKYTDTSGKVLYAKERFEPGRNGRSKEFAVRHLDDNGQWVMGRGCEPVLYRLHELVKSKYAFIVEGESKADLLASWGLVATSFDSGANSSLKDEHIQILGTLEKITILPDKDIPGREYAHRIASRLHGRVKELKVMELPGLKESEDIIDWEKTPGNNKEKLIEIIGSAPLWTPKECNEQDSSDVQFKVTTIDDMLKYEPPNYLIRPFLFEGTVNLLNALPGVGKSVLSLSIADGIASGKTLWGHFSEIKKGKVLIIDEENPGSVHRSRIEKMSISKDTPIHFIHYQGVRIDNPEYLKALIKLIKEGGYILVIFDSLIRVHSAKENDADEMAFVMQSFRELTKQTNTTVLVIHHERKSRDGERREHSRGSGDIVGAVDCQLVLEEKGATETGKELVLYPGKMRLKSFTPIRLDFNSDTLAISYSGKVLGASKTMLQSVLDLLGENGIKDFKEIQEALGVPEKQLRETLKGALGRELILDSSIKNSPEYKGSPRKQFFKVHPNYRLSNVAMFPPIGGKTCHTEESRPGNNLEPGNMETLYFTECGVVSAHGLPHCHNEKKYVSEGVKKMGIGNMENDTESDTEINPITIPGHGVLVKSGRECEGVGKETVEEIPEVEYVREFPNG